MTEMHGWNSKTLLFGAATLKVRLEQAWTIGLRAVRAVPLWIARIMTPRSPLLRVVAACSLFGLAAFASAKQSNLIPEPASHGGAIRIGSSPEAVGLSVFGSPRRALADDTTHAANTSPEHPTSTRFVMQRFAQSSSSCSATNETGSQHCSITCNPPDGAYCANASGGGTPTCECRH